MVLALILLVASSNAFAQVNLDNQSTTGVTVFESPEADYQTYLPIITREPPPPTPPILFPNGDFEQGPMIWTEFSTHGWELITQFLNVIPYDGKWAVWLGGDSDEISYIEQQVTVPINLPYMSYWYWIDSEDVCGNDFGRVLVNSNQVYAYDLCEANNTNGWVQKVIDLRAYAGQSVLIQIGAECNATLISHLFIDHVGFQYSSSITNHPPEDIGVIDVNPPKSDLLGK
jgi:hypothetical protein